MEHENYYQRTPVIVTAGGTREQIDDVRYIGNFSGGKFGHALAAEYASIYCDVRLLAPQSVVYRYGLPEGVKHAAFTDVESLRSALSAEQFGSLMVGDAVDEYTLRPTLILHAAAVSDFTPIEKVHGKISSAQDELLIRLQRTEKILPHLRDLFGSQAKIVGFKLLSGVREAELIEAAVKQIASSNTDLCIANDLQDIDGDNRKVHVVRPDGKYRTFAGSTHYVAGIVSRLVRVEECNV